MPEKPSEMQNKLRQKEMACHSHTKSATKCENIHIYVHIFRRLSCERVHVTASELCVCWIIWQYTHARKAGVGAASNKRKKPLLGPLLSNAAGYVIATITAVRSQSEAAGKGGQIGQTAPLLR